MRNDCQHEMDAALLDAPDAAMVRDDPVHGDVFELFAKDRTLDRGPRDELEWCELYDGLIRSIHEDQCVCDGFILAAQIRPAIW
ncbi:MAG: hypothetical protein AB8B91_08035 [Rubripirellula sp.]